MRILLIEPAKARVTIGGEDIHIFEPLALEYVAAGVAAEHEVRILDERLDHNVDDVLRDFRPEVVGITGYTVHVNAVRRLFERVKEWNPGTHTVVGGHHATVVPEDFISPSIDVVVIGEGVFPFQEIVGRLQAGQALDGIPGTAVRNNGRLCKTERPIQLDLDALPLPNRKLTARYRSQYYAEWMKPLASIRTSKGCPYRCSFCALWRLTGGSYLKRDPERVVEELAGIDEEYVFFADDESLVDAARMRTLARLIREAGIRKRYFCYGRSDTISRNPDLLAEWRDIGLERVFVGLESFRNEDLEIVGKGSSIDENERAVRILQNLGIDIYASFIVRPEFSKEDFAAFGRYCRSLKLNFAGFAVLTPLPGTDFYEDVKNHLLTHNYDLFDLIHTVLPTELPLQQFYTEYSKLLRTAVSPMNVLSFLGKYPLRELPSNLLKIYSWVSRLKKVHLDY